MKFMRYIPDELLYLIAFGCFVSAIIHSYYEQNKITVYEQNKVTVEFSNGKCVKVIYSNPDFDYNCGNLPKNYEKVYTSGENNG